MWVRMTRTLVTIAVCDTVDRQFVYAAITSLWISVGSLNVIVYDSS